MHAIIPAGGAGTRLWPLSRVNEPKFLCDLTGAGRTLIQQTVDRLASLADNITVVTGGTHAETVKAQVPDAKVIVEPSPRGTMGAIGLAAALVEKDNPDEIVGSFAADHLIGDTDSFRQAVSRAIEIAEQGLVVTIGISPESPSTAYGYIEMGEERGHDAFSVTSFVEKPDADTAQKYLATGRYLWNAGMFVAKAGVLMGALEKFKPMVAESVRQLAARWDDDHEEAVRELWEKMESCVIDTAIAEPLAQEGGVAVVPAEMGWSDIGDYASLADVMEDDARLQQVAPGGSRQKIVTVESPNSLVYSGDKPVVVVGIPGAVVLDMNDVLFVTTLDNAQKVKEAVKVINDEGLEFLA